MCASFVISITSSLISIIWSTFSFSSEKSMYSDKPVPYVISLDANTLSLLIDISKGPSCAISSPEFIVAMNHPSLIRFQNQIQSGGLFFINSSLVKAEISRGDVDIVNVPANRIAEELDNPKSANIVMLGAFTKKSNIVSLSSVIEGLKGAFKSKQKLIAINEKALMAGYDLF